MGELINENYQEILRQNVCLCLSTIIVTILLYYLIDYYRNVCFYWQNKCGIKGNKPLVPLLSDLAFVTKCQMKLSLERTRKYGKIYGTSFVGRKRLVINDAEVIKQIAVKDFDKFQDHTVNEWHDKYTRNSLVWITGDHWKRVRALMLPTFTGGKIKKMFKLLDQCADDLVESFRELFIRARRNGDQCAIIDLQELFLMYTLDGITTCCYGIKLKRQQLRDVKLLKNKRQVASTRDTFITDLNAYLKFNWLRMVTLVFVPKFLLRAMKFTISSESKMKPIVDRLQKIIDLRRENKGAAGGGACGGGNDFLQLLIDAKFDDQVELSSETLDQIEQHYTGGSALEEKREQAKLKDNSSCRTTMGLSDIEILSQALLFLGAGVETTRTLLASCTYFLAHNQSVQVKLFDEINKIANYTQTLMGKHLIFDYDQLASCQYLDAVISETLRIFPPAIYTDRYAKQEYFIEKYNLTIPKDVQVLFGLYSVQMDPDYWCEPEKFDPNRFMPGQREKIIPGSYAPFSLGPRHCIGMRFSLIEAKLAIAKLLMNFEFKPAPNTKYPFPDTKLTLGIINMRNCKIKLLLREG